MSEIEIKVPNIGDFKDVEVIEVLVSEGQTLKKNDPLITIESDKSSVEIPSNFDGKIKTLKISFEKQNSNKEFYDDKINTGKYYFEKILPRAQSHYVVGTSGSHTTMNAKFN